MNIFAKLWAWITGLFEEKSAPNAKPDVDQPADLEQVPDTAPDDDVVPKIDKIGMYADIVYFEMHNRELATLLRNPAVKRDMQSFLESADITEMVSHYSDEALNRVRGSGTNWAFTPEISAAISEAVREELTKRNNTVAPDRNGMAPDGGQR